MHFQDRMVFLNRVLFARGFNGNAWKMHTDKWLGNPVETNTTDRLNHILKNVCSGLCGRPLKSPSEGCIICAWYSFRWWKKRQTLMQTANFQGRQRNCWKLAIRKLHKTLEFVTQGREQFRRDFKQLSEQRIEAAANENGYNAYNIRDCLSRSG